MIISFDKERISGILNIPPVKEGYVINVTDKQTGEGDLYCVITGHSETLVTMNTFTCINVNVDSPCEFIVGAEFIPAIKALLTEKDILTLNIEKESVRCTCGNSAITLPLKKDIMKYVTKSPQKEAAATLKIDSSELKRINKCIFAVATNGFSPESRMASFSSVCLTFGEDKMRVLATDSHLGASTELQLKETDDNFKARKDSYICLPKEALKTVLSLIKSKEVVLHIFDNQICVQDGYDAYFINLYKYAYMVENLVKIFDDEQREFFFTCDPKSLVVASNVLSVNSGANACVDMTVKDNKVTFSLNGSTSHIPTNKCEGEINISYSLKHLKDILSSAMFEEETVNVFGVSNSNPIHVVGSNIKTILLPIVKR